MAVRNAKPEGKAHKNSDGSGLYLEVTPAGSKLWRMKYRQDNGKENRLSFGSYPQTSLGAAREKRAAARKLLADGAGRKHDAAAALARHAAGNSFQSVGCKYPAPTGDGLLSEIGSMPIADITCRRCHRQFSQIDRRNSAVL